MERRKADGEAGVGAPATGAGRAEALPPEVLAATLAPVPGADAAGVRFGLSLLVALAATLPAFVNVVEGRVSLVVAAARFLAAVAVAWAGSTLAAKLFSRRPAPAADLTTAGAPAELVPGDAPGAR